MDASGKMCLLQFKSHKAYCVVKNAMDSRTLAFAASFDAGFLIRRLMEIILGRGIPMSMLTDSKCLFDVLTSTRTRPSGDLCLTSSSPDKRTKENESIISALSRARLTWLTI